MSVHHLVTSLAAAALAAAGVPAPGDQPPIMLRQSGGFPVGGKTVANPANPAQHLSCDHGYVEYFIPEHRRNASLVMWHSSSAQVWQNRWDGGEGFKDMFLRRGYPVYLWDGPRVGRANWGCEQYNYIPIYRDEQNFKSWNFGPSYPNWWPDVQFPTDDEGAWQRATRARYAEFDHLANVQLQAEAAAAAADSGKLGDRIVYLTNSAGGLRAMLATTKTQGSNIAAIVAYESIGYVFPIGDPESPPLCTDLQACGFGPVGVPVDDFKKLAKLAAIQFVWGDNRLEEGPNAKADVAMSRLAARLINKYGGNAEVLKLGEIGLKGSTHIPFADLDNARVGELLDAFLSKNGLDGYPGGEKGGRWVWQPDE